MSGGITSWIWGSSQLDDAVDKATSEFLPTGSEDIALNLEICDQIRSKTVSAKDAMKAVKRRLNHKNPNVQLLALNLTDTCVKNGGDLFLQEIASREFMDNLVSILKMPALNMDVKNLLLKFIQNWSTAFEGKPTLSYVNQIYRTLCNEGFKFPPKDFTAASSAMVDTQTAPEWIDSEVCLRCRTPFSFTNRKHHCRNCGQVFDQQCSSKVMALPHYGITQEVRVCDGCFTKLNRKSDKTSAKPQRQSTGQHQSNQHQNSQNHRHRSARELDDEELQRAIQLSLQESSGARQGYTPAQPASPKYFSEPPIVDRSKNYVLPGNEEEDPDLRAAIEASLREANAPKASAPVFDLPRPDAPYAQPPNVPAAPLPQLPNYDLRPHEEDAVLTFNQTVEQAYLQGGRDLSRYPAVTQLYDQANSLRPKLALGLDDAARKEEMLVDMHAKLSEAVKLYDQLLTEQLAHPRWRSPQGSSVPPAHRPAEALQHTLNQQQQWYNPAPVPEHAQMQYSAPSGVHEAPYPSSEQQSGWSTQYAQTNPTYAAPVSIPQFTPPIQYTQNEYHAQAPSLQSVSVPPPPPLASQPAQTTSTPTSPGLSRHNTVAHSASPGPYNTHLARSNTVAYAPQRQPVQQQYALSPQAVPSLPQFPVAPTNAPQGYAAYNATHPAQTEERKEALLIEL